MTVRNFIRPRSDIFATLFHIVKPPTFSFFELFFGNYFRKRRSTHSGRGGNVTFLTSSFSARISRPFGLAFAPSPSPGHIAFTFWIPRRFACAVVSVTTVSGDSRWRPPLHDPCRRRTPETPSARRTCPATGLTVIRTRRGVTCPGTATPAARTRFRTRRA